MPRSGSLLMRIRHAQKNQAKELTAKQWTQVVCFGCSFGLFFVVVSLLVIFSWLLPELNMSQKSVEWPQATGVITISAVRPVTSDEVGTYYVPDVTYDYTVDLKKMSGSESILECRGVQVQKTRRKQR